MIDWSMFACTGLIDLITKMKKYSTINWNEGLLLDLLGDDASAGCGRHLFSALKFWMMGPVSEWRALESLGEFGNF